MSFNHSIIFRNEIPNFTLKILEIILVADDTYNSLESLLALCLASPLFSQPTYQPASHTSGQPHIRPASPLSPTMATGTSSVISTVSAFFLRFTLT